MRSRIPSYRRHTSSGRAVVTINGKDIYLGKFGSVESRVKYANIIAEFTSQGRVDLSTSEKKPEAIHEKFAMFAQEG